eukprot:CAMPEP_0182866846 /NCGR_PEP_ID=MMETSP0034_2-20130328/8411_1 /TAXON_ID=156128 /ORGANISM="Nephroselmis pyriformis, Strain CCMP717" /LENGTH=330 /DNA_ID=CAMNT_0024999179 /DNA_START=54 /DNA_END=1046 /DNA_ORIENTATION=+
MASKRYGFKTTVIHRLCFFFDIMFLQFFIPIAALLYDTFGGGRVQMYKWCVEWLGVRYKKVGKQTCHVPEDGARVMYLCNHRSWGDFIIDRVLTGFQGCYLSRFMVVLGLPIAALLGWLTGAVWFFNRGRKGTDRNALFAMMDRNLHISPDAGIIVYPEGHRNTKDASLPLKTGCIKYAWDRRIHVQIIIANGKEFILDEKNLFTRLKQDIRVAFSDAICPEDYNNYDDFLAAIQNCWREYWLLVYPEGSEGGEGKGEAATPKTKAKGKARALDTPIEGVRWQPPVIERAIPEDVRAEVERAQQLPRAFLQGLRALIVAAPLMAGVVYLS